LYLLGHEIPSNLVECLPPVLWVFGVGSAFWKGAHDWN